MSFSQWTFYKWRQSGCALTLDFSQEQDFPGSSLLQRSSRTPEELLSGSSFLRRRLQRTGSSQSGEDCSSIDPSPERTAPTEFQNNAGASSSAENRFFSTWSAVMRLVPGKSCYWSNPVQSQTTHIRDCFFPFELVDSKALLWRRNWGGGGKIVFLHLATII
jgi:hypothetical protein